jgi:uncharacterized protein YjiS (DUF1127 family)
MTAMNNFSLASKIARPFNWFSRGQRRERRDAYLLLNRYDDHMLRDIGLTRGDVEDLRR